MKFEKEFPELDELIKIIEKGLEARILEFWYLFGQIGIAVVKEIEKDIEDLKSLQEELEKDYGKVYSGFISFLKRKSKKLRRILKRKGFLRKVGQALKEKVWITEEAPVRFEPDWRGKDYSSWAVFSVDGFEVRIPYEVMKKVIEEM